MAAKNIERNLALPCADNRLASGAENGCARERKMMRKIKRQLSLTSDKTDDLEEKPEEDEDVSVSEDIGNVAGVRLEVSAAHWDLDETGQIATLRADPSIRICYLNWEQCQDRVAEQLEADVILGAGSEGLSYSVVEGPQEVYFHYERMVPIEILEITAP
nr:hypothetical protein BaRGS_024547 [Batillaria attramentaria]